ncbi:MAG: hypothetical protein IKK92_10620 [Prevotella sp.]|nr:hypothetical protein [Prevotella sp.]
MSFEYHGLFLLSVYLNAVETFVNVVADRTCVAVDVAGDGGEHFVEFATGATLQNGYALLQQILHVVGLGVGLLSLLNFGLLCLGLLGLGLFNIRLLGLGLLGLGLFNIRLLGLGLLSLGLLGLGLLGLGLLNLWIFHFGILRFWFSCLFLAHLLYIFQ